MYVRCTPPGDSVSSTSLTDGRCLPYNVSTICGSVKAM